MWEGEHDCLLISTFDQSFRSTILRGSEGPDNYMSVAFPFVSYPIALCVYTISFHSPAYFHYYKKRDKYPKDLKVAGLYVIILHNHNVLTIHQFIASCCITFKKQAKAGITFQLRL